MPLSKTWRLAGTALVVSALTAVTTASALANFQAGDRIGSSVSEIALALENEGYDIREIEVKGNRIDADVTLNGTKLEIKIDRTSGEVVRVEND